MIHKISRIFHASRLNKKILFMAMPVFIGMVNHTAVQIADTMMVGELGALALASTGFGGVTYFTILSFLMGGSISVQILTSRRFGEKNFQGVGRTAITAIHISLVVGTLLSFFGFHYGESIMRMLGDKEDVIQLSGVYLSYRFLGTVFFFFIFMIRGFLDGLGFTYVGMIAAFVTTASNIFFNWILIYGNLGFPALGVKGAALASSISGIPGVIVFFIYLFHKDIRIYFHKLNFFPDLPLLKELIILGAAPAFESTLTNISFVIFTKFAGMISTVALAASNIVFTVISLSFMPGFSFGVAATTILGQAMGQGKYRLAYEGTFRSASYSAIIMGLMGFFFISMGSWIISFFTNDPLVAKEAYPALVVVALVQVGDAYHMVVGSALRSAGLVYWVLIAYVSISFCIMLPLAYFLGNVLGYGTAGLWSAVFIWLLILSILFVWKFRKREWIHIKI